MLGHSERRELFGETDADVAAKFSACVEKGSLVPILCVGESLVERQAQATEAVVAKQIDVVLDQVGIAGLANSVIAYEPVWAIGTGLTATAEQIGQVHAGIRQHLVDVFGGQGESVRILYGGSMKPGNAAEILAVPNVNGGLIGGASLKAEDFLSICNKAV